MEYRQYTHIMGGQKETKVAGMPFLSVPQIMAPVVVGGGGLFIGLPIPFVILLALFAVAGTYSHRGEYIFIRLYKAVASAVLVRLKRPTKIALEDAWKAVSEADKTTPRSALIYRTDGGVSMVSSSEG